MIYERTTRFNFFAHNTRLLAEKGASTCRNKYFTVTYSQACNAVREIRYKGQHSPIFGAQNGLMVEKGAFQRKPEFERIWRLLKQGTHLRKRATGTREIFARATTLTDFGNAKAPRNQERRY